MPSRGPCNHRYRPLGLILAVGCVAAGLWLWRVSHALFPDYRP